VTLPDDLRRVEGALAPVPIRVGFGHDSHPFGPGTGLRLGGIEIPGAPRLAGHSDGDVVLHAICDAILGAIGRGDIGAFFPDTDERYRGADSADLLRAVIEMMHKEGFRIVNLDLTVSAERPRLGAHRDDIRRRVAELTGADVARINLKAKTNEGLDAIGRVEAIAATAVVLLQSGPEASVS
jgi:2-C-methyl-D-erythritol 2,4-cyclodiphosphate synthase